jgi:hypothetical protein
MPEKNTRTIITPSGTSLHTIRIPGNKYRNGYRIPTFRPGSRRNNRRNNSPHRNGTLRRVRRCFRRMCGYNYPNSNNNKGV